MGYVKCEWVYKVADEKKKVKRYKTRKQIRLEKFLIDEIERYIRLHKEHEKEIKYIG